MILDVPFYSQIKDTQKEEWKELSCGIVALKMVLDFYGPTNLSIDELYQKGLDIGGYLENVGWYHHSLALLAKQLGFQAITRLWGLPEEYAQKLKNRGFNESELQILEDQQLDEGILTLKKELENGRPVILSVSKGFGREGRGHLVVLIGSDDQGFILHDPFEVIRPGKEFKITFNEFKQAWTRRAIIIRQA
jgi:hypothetical protein